MAERARGCGMGPSVTLPQPRDLHGFMLRWLRACPVMLHTRLERLDHPARTSGCGPLPCKAIASAWLNNDKVDAAILAQLLRAGLLPEALVQQDLNRTGHP
jgi:hypothetical protein